MLTIDEVLTVLHDDGRCVLYSVPSIRVAVHSHKNEAIGEMDFNDFCVLIGERMLEKVPNIMPSTPMRYKLKGAN